MSRPKRIFLTPEVSEREFRRIWSAVIGEVKRRPGRTVILDFAPGEYPLPDSGELVYVHEPFLYVREPGAEMTITYLADIQKLDITYKSVMWGEEIGGAA